jgi:DNA-directed RNA polymerase specialized sigma24 family protein
VRPGSAILPAGELSGPAVNRVTVREDADRGVTALYGEHYQSLVRLATFLVRDMATAEQVVQDSFVALHGAWWRLANGERALGYLRRSVVNRSRSAGQPQLAADGEFPALIRALRALPARQREALVLCYYGGLSEAEIASAMGTSQGAVRGHLARAMSSLPAAPGRSR